MALRNISYYLDTDFLFSTLHFYSTMHFLIAPDAFKDSLTAQEACRAMAKGLASVSSDLTYEAFPMADGGEGTLEALVQKHQGSWLSLSAKDPLGREITARYGVAADRKTAFIDLPQASGLMRLQQEERNPMKTSSYGTGQLIRAAVEAGAESLLIGIGGSATSDAGMGIAQALGFVFEDESGQVLEANGENLSNIVRIVPSIWWEEYLHRVHVEVLCDVDNPLFGEDGAAYTYAPQKGASPDQVVMLDQGLRQIASVWESAQGVQAHNTPGAGAAGGVGWGLMAFLDAQLTPGAQALMDYTGLAQAIAQKPAAILTGEGQIDRQTQRGKVAHTLAQAAAKHDIPVIAFCGGLKLSYKEVRALGLSAAHSIQTQPQPLERALEDADKRLEECVAQVVGTAWALS